jgi:hypothetical protein
VILVAGGRGVSCASGLSARTGSLTQKASFGALETRSESRMRLLNRIIGSLGSFLGPVEVEPDGEALGVGGP